MENECIKCLSSSFEKQLEISKAGEELRKTLRKNFNFYVNSLNGNITTPEAAREIHLIISNGLMVADFHKTEKQKSNNFVLNRYSELKKMVKNSDNPFDTALRLSIAGNIMDFAACPEFYDDSENYFQLTVDRVLNSDFSIDHSKQLEDEIKNAKTILMLGDNTGEIVMDKLFLETISHPNVYYALRGGPVLNDATVEDAYEIGLDKLAKIISNGYNAPSTILNKVSEDFMKIWNKADLIISKGQGNLEGLLDNHRPDIFFLLMVKCNVIGNKLGVNKGGFVVIKNKYIN